MEIEENKTTMLNLIWTCISVIVIAVAIDLCLRNKKGYRALRKGYMPPLYPIIGNISFMFLAPEDLWKYPRHMATTLKQGYGLSSLGMSMFLAVKASEVEAILSGTANAHKGDIYKLLYHFIGDGLLSSKESKWLHRRRILTPTFHFNILEKFFAIFSEESTKLIADIKIKSENKEEIDLCRILPRFTLNSICETAMGVKLEETENSNLYRETIKTINEMLVRRLTKPWFHPMFIYNCFGEGRAFLKKTALVHKFSSDIIKKRRQIFLTQKNESQENHNENIYTSKKRRYAMLDTLLQLNKII